MKSPELIKINDSDLFTDESDTPSQTEEVSASRSSNPNALETFFQEARRLGGLVLQKKRFQNDQISFSPDYFHDKLIDAALPYTVILIPEKTVGESLADKQFRFWTEFLAFSRPQILVRGLQIKLDADPLPRAYYSLPSGLSYIVIQLRIEKNRGFHVEFVVTRMEPFLHLTLEKYFSNDYPHFVKCIRNEIDPQLDFPYELDRTKNLRGGLIHLGSLDKPDQWPEIFDWMMMTADHFIRKFVDFKQNALNGKYKK